MGDRTPVFNGEFPKLQNALNRLIVGDPGPTKATPPTHRGQVEFKFIGPMEAQNQKLAAVYRNSRPTAGVKSVMSKKYVWLLPR